MGPWDQTELDQAFILFMEIRLLMKNFSFCVHVSALEATICWTLAQTKKVWFCRSLRQDSGRSVIGWKLTAMRYMAQLHGNIRTIQSLLMSGKVPFRSTPKGTLIVYHRKLNATKIVFNFFNKGPFSTWNHCWNVANVSSKSQIGCALALANFSFCQSSGPIVQHYCHGMTILNRLRMYGNGYSMAIVLDHRSTATSLTGH